MKTITTFLLSLSLLPAALSAQPTMTKNEFYYTGDVIQMVNCDASTVSAGASGSNVTWDFSSLVASGGIYTVRIMLDTFPVFASSSSLMAIFPNNTVAFLQENNTDTYINGMYDTGTHITTYYSFYHDSKRPFTFNSNYADSYRVNIPATGAFGTGLIAEAGDAYGTLILPTGTFENVLRVRKVRVEHDTVGASDYITTATSYMWFDTGHSAPLLRIDSLSSASAESQTVRYLLSSTGVGNVKSSQNNFTGYLDNSEHLIVNGFESGKNYQIVLYNIIGNKVFSDDVFTSGSLHKFDIRHEISPGIYILRISEKGDPNSVASVVKVIKAN